MTLRPITPWSVLITSTLEMPWVRDAFELIKLVSAIAGGVAGISIDFALFPVDSIKTRLQVMDYLSSLKYLPFRLHQRK